MQIHNLISYGINIVAITILVLGVYFPRHRRRDLVVAFYVVNLGVMAVCAVLSTFSLGAAGAGIGLGLFGVLSIIRLRSTELSQREVAYFFASLAFGLIGGLGAAFGILVPILMGVILVAIAIVDHPRFLGGNKRQTMVLDKAFTDHDALISYLEQTLSGRVLSANIQRVDLVNDTTWVDVCYSTKGTTRAHALPKEMPSSAPAPAQAVRPRPEPRPTTAPTEILAAPVVQAQAMTQAEVDQVAYDLEDDLEATNPRMPDETGWKPSTSTAWKSR